MPIIYFYEWFPKRNKTIHRWETAMNTLSPLRYSFISTKISSLHSHILESSAFFALCIAVNP